jgi:putative cardiolipin synthase
MRLILPLLLLPSLLFPSPAQRLALDLQGETKRLLKAHPGQSAALTLERGELSLLTRAWLAQNAARSLDVQYFIWTPDNVGRLAMQGLLKAADRGVHVRVLVDDFLLELPPELLAAMDGHPNLEIRVYSPNSNLGVPAWKRAWNTVAHFRAVNQRMHNKGLIVDGQLAVTGGRNLADEYFDFDHEFNFRDRDILVAGPVAAQMQAAFDTYWNSPYAVRVSDLVPAASEDTQAALRRSIHQYAENPEHFAPDVRKALNDLPKSFDAILKELAWGPAQFIIDAPGKNDGRSGLAGGGLSTRFLAGLLRSAKTRLTIETPYLIPDGATMALFRELVAKGVKIRICTNSMANNDNLQAVSGYLNRRAELLAAGVQVFEYKPEPGIQGRLQERYAKLKEEHPIFVVHAKTVVVDSEKAFIGTFNLDPRSMNLNTESGVLVEHRGLAAQVEAAIEQDMAPENSWEAAKETGDAYAGWGRRLKTWVWGWMPIEALI